MNLCVAAARRAAWMVCALVLAGGVLAAPAAAKVDITGLIAKPIPAGSSCSTTTATETRSQAGAHEDFCIAMAFNGHGSAELGNIPGLGDDVRDLRMSMPTGQVGGATATPTCSAAKFQSTGGCPSSAQVGEASARIEGIVPLTESLLKGQIFNLAPRGAEAARLGIQLELAGIAAVQKVEAVITLRGGDGGLDAVSVGQPRDFLGIPIELRRFNLKLWGSKTEHPSLLRSFVVNPTDCSRPATTTVHITSYAGVDETASASYQPTGCDRLSFTPSMILEGDRQADAPASVTAGLTFPDSDEPLAQPKVKRAAVVLPPGFELSPSAGSEPGFVGCTDEQFAASSAAPAACPAGAKVGTVLFRSPLIADPLAGTVYVAEQRPGKPRIRMFIFAETGPAPEAVRVKLTANAVADPSTGQLTTTLEDIPAVPFTEFRLTFRGGPTAIIATPRTCATRTGSTTVVPDNGGAAATPTARIATDLGCGDPARFAPGMGASLSTAWAGAPTVLTMGLSRPDGHARLTSAHISLPAGFSGKLTAAPACPPLESGLGTCGPESRVGSVRALAGPGPSPTLAEGDVFLTAPLVAGDLAGLSIVVPAKFGPLSFGNLVSVARIVVRPDIGLDIIVNEIPRRVDGISVQLRAMVLTIDRAGFGYNATSCTPLGIVARLASDLGGTALVGAPYQAVGCDRISYAPTIDATLGGGAEETLENGHPTLSTTVGSQLGNGNTQGLELTLPDGLSIDVDRIKRSCPLARYEAGTCPDEAIIGDAVAITPLLPVPLRGAVTFVSVPGTPLPELRIDLKGPISITLAGKIRQEGTRLVAEVSGLPDTPLSRFALTLAGGDRGLLQASRDLCSTDELPLDAAFHSFTGTTSTRTVNPEIPDCAPAGTLRVSSLRGGRPALDLRVVGGRTRMETTQLILPSGVEFQRASVVKRLLRVSAAGLKKGSRAKVTVTGHSIRVSVPEGESARILRVRLARGSVRVSKRLRSRGRPRLTFRLRSSLSDGRRPSLRVRARPAASP